MTTAWTGGPSFEVTYEAGSKKLKFVVTVPKHMYFGLAFNKGMINTDSLVFTNTSTGVGHVHDMWSTSNSTPTRDANQSITTTMKTDATTKATTFTVMRSLNTGDAS